MKPGITVAIPTIPPRAHLLQRAVASVLAQTHPAAGLAIAIDYAKQGAGGTRQRALDMVDTQWVAFLDDDDEFMPTHLETLWNAAHAHSADYVYAWYETVPFGCDPFPASPHYLDPWDPTRPRQTTVTTLVRTELAKEVGFANFTETGELIDGQRWGEDYAFTLGCNEKGKIHHVVAKTWYWHHDSGNTSGRSDRW